MKFRNALLSATLLALPVAASAQPITGLYIGANAGVNVMANQDATFSRSPFGGKSNLDTHFGPAGGMSLGYGFGNGLRAEIEGDVMENSPQSFPGARSVAGQELKYGGMGNLLYDFVDLTPYVTPYIGAGAGYQEQQLSNLRVVAPSGAALQTGRSSKGGFAWQALAGVAFPISPALALTIDYRFMELTGSRDYGAAVSLPAGRSLRRTLSSAATTTTWLSLASGTRSMCRRLRWPRLPHRSHRRRSLGPTSCSSIGTRRI